MPDAPIQGRNVGLAAGFLLAIAIITAWLASQKRLRLVAGLFLLTLFLGTLVYQWPYLSALFGIGQPAARSGLAGTNNKLIPGYSN